MDDKDLNKLDKIFNRQTIFNYNNQSSLILMTAKELYSIYDLIKHPTIQTTLNDDKIQEMKDIYNNNNLYKHHFLSCCLITIARIIIGDKQDYYLIDGQHRVNMAFELLYKDKNDNKSFLVAIINIKSKKEMLELFKKINKDSKKIPEDIIIDLFAEQLYEELKILLKNNFLFLPTKASRNTKLYTINEFIEIIIKENIIKNNYTAIDFLNFLIKKDKDFYNEIGYLEEYHQNSSNFGKREIISIENNSCMFMKNNNFIEWLKYKNITPKHNFSKRIPIPPLLREQVWSKEFGAHTNGNCPIYNCQNILDKKVSNSWHCGHIISHNNKGETTLDNLRPICSKCNIDMSDTNWKDYELKIMKDDIIETFYDEDCSYKCCSKLKCNNIVNINNFYPYYYLTKKSYKLKPICKTCFNLINNI